MKEPYYKTRNGSLNHGDNIQILPLLADNSIDCIVTDPQYGWSFMGKEWDKAIPTVELWKHCLRVLKPGAFAFIMSGARSDCLAHNIINIGDAGFNVNFTPIFWTYASGFPKATNISKAVDKRLGIECEKMPIGKAVKRMIPGADQDKTGSWIKDNGREYQPGITIPATPHAKALDGSYAGFQPKPAVEIIIVAMKPLSEKTYVDQALKNGKGITWLDDGRIPYESDGDKESSRFGTQMDIRKNNLKSPIGIKAHNVLSSENGRFPANLLVSDDVLNDGKEHNSGYMNQDIEGRKWVCYGQMYDRHVETIGDSGSYCRFFSLDAWWEQKLKQLPKETQKTFPFLLVPKASKGEKNKGRDELPEKHTPTTGNNIGGRPHNEDNPRLKQNIHPTVKPVELMSYLITLGSQLGDIILDPFIGSGTTALASEVLNRKWIGIEIDEESCNIAKHRLEGEEFRDQTGLFEFGSRSPTL